ncbi:MAG: hypothetical protein IJI38_09430 [Clostridia bacterium]|nr:hypothetical protein [Clostridia bacterium]
MRSNNRSNALLVELLIVVLFFMLAATVLLQVFAAARNQSVQAEELSAAVAEAQNVADALYAAEDAGALLESLGFSKSGDGWKRDEEMRQFLVTVSEEDAPGGVMRVQSVTVCDPEGKEWLSLPCSRYQEVSP